MVNFKEKENEETERRGSHEEREIRFTPVPGPVMDCIAGTALTLSSGDLCVSADVIGR